jgi:prolyl-tRNA synthetase
LEKEAEHVEGFAKECAVVTHHRLEPDPEKGGLRPAPSARLEEPLIVRPTSETIIGATFARWVQSYRDLPILINQWANVVRWELRTRMFLRTAEFLWQEGHTVHATAEEAKHETLQMLDVYAEFVEGSMAVPVIKGVKTAGERFPGAVDTYTIETMMQDRKALQAGTSHFLGQNFSKAQDIKFQNENGELEYAWTTSWGMTTRLIGAMVMTHSDDDGLVLPPKLAPAHVVITPIYRNDDERAQVLPYVESLKSDLAAQQYDGETIRVRIDDRDIRGGDKKWHWIKRGVPIRLEIGGRDIEGGTLMPARRDSVEKPAKLARNEFVANIAGTLDDIQKSLLERASKAREAASVRIDSLAEFEKFFTPKDQENPEIHGGLAYSHFVDSDQMNEKLKDLKATVRCVPIDATEEQGKCIFTGRPSARRAVFAKAY